MMAMWIRHLEVSGCAGIKAAGVSLQPGLNVLHGPNELGKSTLVRAMRAALLLPSSSSVADSLKAWNVDGLPAVALTFEQGPQRIWRVSKRFGRTGGHTYLEFSRDGKEFSQDGRGREVEAKLQNILRWGIEPPGGQGGRRGMPQSFISTALLGDQSDVNAILAASLADDPNATGRERLTNAMQAMAEDSRFKQVLASVQERFDEAFTPTGLRRRDHNSPWSQLHEERLAAEQREQDTRQQVEDSEAARSCVTKLREFVLEAEMEADRAAGAFQAEQAAQRLREERAAAAGALAVAEDALENAQTQFHNRDEKEAAVLAAEQERNTLHESFAEAEQALVAVQPLVEAARERVLQLDSADAEQARRLREQMAQNQRLQLTQQQTELEARVAESQRLADRESAIATSQADIANRTQALSEQRQSLTDAQNEIESLKRKRECVLYMAAAKQAEALAVERDAARTQAETAQTLEDQANQARAEAEALNAPALAELEDLKRLDAERRVAEGKLAVGLAFEFTPDNETTAEVTLDGETTMKRFDAGECLRFEARRELRLAIEGVGVLQVRGGGRNLRQEAEAATQSWRTVADDLCGRAGVATSAELEQRRSNADKLLAKAAEDDAKATEARLRSENLDELERGAVAAKAEADQRREAAATRMAAGVSLDDFINEHGELRNSEDLAQTIHSLEEKVRERETLCMRLEQETELEATQLDDLRQHLESAQQEFTNATANNQAWRQVLGEVAAERQQLADALGEVEAQIAAIQAEATAAAEDARQALAEIMQDETVRTAARNEAQQRLQDAEVVLAQLQGEANALNAAVEGLDLPGVQAARDEKQAQLDALPAVDDAPEDTAELERLADDAANRVDSRRHQLSNAQGALAQVGGPRIEERAAQAEEALAALDRRGHELEVEYGGWKLLREMLVEAEQEHATHLGEALVKPVSERMAALTGGRYSEVGIGPQLDATGIHLGGEERSLGDVSVGTREQIALLLRLSIAEALGSFVILDDHLTQSDPDRMAWMRELLGKAAQNIQVVVMTCHPDAYLTGGEIGAANAVDLAECIERHEVA